LSPVVRRLVEEWSLVTLTSILSPQVRGGGKRAERELFFASPIRQAQGRLTSLPQGERERSLALRERFVVKMKEEIPP